MSISNCGVFSHDVMTVTVVLLNNEKLATLVFQISPTGVWFFFYTNSFFCFNGKQDSLSHEWKGSIVERMKHLKSWIQKLNLFISCFFQTEESWNLSHFKQPRFDETGNSKKIFTQALIFEKVVILIKIGLVRRKVVEKETEEVAMKGYTAWHQGEGYH